MRLVDWMISWCWSDLFLGPRLVYDREFKGDTVYRVVRRGRTVGLVVWERRPKGSNHWAAYRGKKFRCRYMGNFSSKNGAAAAAAGY